MVAKREECVSRLVRLMGNGNVKVVTGILGEREAILLTLEWSSLRRERTGIGKRRCCRLLNKDLIGK